MRPPVLDVRKTLIKLTLMTIKVNHSADVAPVDQA